MMQEAEVHILLGIKNNIVCIRQPNQLVKKFVCFQVAELRFYFYPPPPQNKNYSNYYVILFACVCCLDFDTLYSERKNEYKKSKQVKIDELFLLQYNYFEVQIELNCRICTTKWPI